jgi:hypothetical protein
LIAVGIPIASVPSVIFVTTSVRIMVASGIAVIVAIIAFTIVPIVVFAAVSVDVSIPIIVRVIIKLPITRSAPRHSTLAQPKISSLFEPSDIDKETPDVSILSPIGLSRPQPDWERALVPISAHYMMKRLSRTTARSLPNVSHCSAEGFGEVLGAVNRLCITVPHLVSCDREFGHALVALP